MFSFLLSNRNCIYPLWFTLIRGGQWCFFFYLLFVSLFFCRSCYSSQGSLSGPGWGLATLLLAVESYNFTNITRISRTVLICPVVILPLASMMAKPCGTFFLYALPSLELFFALCCAAFVHPYLSPFWIWLDASLFHVPLCLLLSVAHFLSGFAVGGLLVCSSLLLIWLVPQEVSQWLGTGLWCWSSLARVWVIGSKFRLLVVGFVF